MNRHTLERILSRRFSRLCANDRNPWYRVYFAEDGEFVILLGGGKKKTQGRDIVTAKERWKEYNA